MATYAMMSGNSVSNVIMADDKEATEVALRCTLIEFTSENPAGIGWSYDQTTGRFIATQPYPSWVFDQVGLEWKAPTLMPEDGKMYQWDEDALNWNLLE